jgi:hypothetical protein
LCEAGPCFRYHRLEIQVDAEDPRAQKVPVRLPVLSPGMEAAPDGTIYRAPAVYHTVTEHYCYPEMGIEMALGPTPVVECNRWVPLRHAPATTKEIVKADFLASPEGIAYRDAVARWELERERQAAEAAEAERQIADALAAQEEP